MRWARAGCLPAEVHSATRIGAPPRAGMRLPPPAQEGDRASGAGWRFCERW